MLLLESCALGLRVNDDTRRWRVFRDADKERGVGRYLRLSSILAFKIEYSGRIRRISASRIESTLSWFIDELGFNE